MKGRWLNFSSNDYRLVAWRDYRHWQQGRNVSIGSGGSGRSASLERIALEELADWLGYPRALLFISGFAANQALIAALAKDDHRIVWPIAGPCLPAGQPQPGAAAPHPSRNSLLNCWRNRWTASS